MAFASKKRKSSAVLQDDSDGPAEASTKRGKSASGTAVQTSPKAQLDSDGNPFWEISKARRVTISEFKGKTLVNIREYYDKDGQTLPGKKGISMSIEQYSSLIELLPQIEELLESRAVKVPRPDYSGTAKVDDEDDDDREEDDEDEDMDTKKANIEATSDEEE